MSEKVAYPTVTPSWAEHLNTEVEVRMHAAGLKGVIHLPGPDQADKWFLVIPIQQADKQ